MNSSEDISINQIMQDDVPTSSQLQNSDNNANPNQSQSKGAIPKTKNKLRMCAMPKKPAKLNNNIEELSTPKCSSEEILQIHNDVLRFNGISDRLCRFSTNYGEDYQSILYKSAESSCESIPSTLNRNSNHYSCTHESNPTTVNNIASDMLSFSLHQPSTSNSVEKVNLQAKIDSDSSSDDNELLSISDDGCIYTYKGDHQAADLPSSFFNLDVPPAESPEIIIQNREQNASPEMDFLEMDFDPGPSGDADSDCGSGADLESAENLPKDLENETHENHILLENQLSCSFSVKNDVNIKRECTCLQQQQSNTLCEFNKSEPGSSQTQFLFNRQGINTMCRTTNPRIPIAANVKREPPPNAREKPKTIKMPWSCTVAQRTTSSSILRSSRRHQNSYGELFSPSERLHSPSMDFSKSGENENLENVMIWSPQEATVKQVSQISVSACGATAVLNVLNALRLPVPPIDKIQENVTTRLRANASPLTEYLLSRSVAGCSHVDIIKGLETISNGSIYARFFHMYPERVVNLHSWLGFWIKHGAVPIATLNLQKCSGSIPDAWHHQMIFGIGPQGICLTNPLECVEAGQLWPQLCSESILLIRRDDILSRWNPKIDLHELIKLEDTKWRKMNVVGK